LALLIIFGLYAGCSSEPEGEGQTNLDDQSRRDEDAAQRMTLADSGARHSRGMYVSIFADSHAGGRTPYPLEETKFILGHERKEKILIDFSKNMGFNRLSLYGINTVLSSKQGEESLAQSRLHLASFIREAHGQGLIVDAVIESCTPQEPNTCADILAYQEWLKNNPSGLDVSSSAKLKSMQFDGLLTEFEFWNTGDNATFQRYLTTLDYLNQLKKEYGLSVTTYLGWLDKKPEGISPEDKAKAIADRRPDIYLHCYVRSPEQAIGYCRERWRLLREKGPDLKIFPLYSAEGEEYKAGRTEWFMGNWTRDRANSMNFSEALNGAEYPFSDGNLNPDGFNAEGFQYYSYQFLYFYYHSYFANKPLVKQ
jgi:hypothetical protein